MKAFLDTSVLVAAFYGDHEHHKPSIAVLAQQTRSTGSTAAHCLAEACSVITGMPGKDRATPDEALLFLRDVRERLGILALDETEYWAVLDAVASRRLSGGAIYDALIARCATKSKAQTLYTWNVKHFKRFGEPIAARVREPEAAES